MIKRIVIKNFKIFDSFELNLNPDLNIIVGDNETGKSTLLEAICLALTKKIGGRALEYELSPFLFNKETSNAYLQEIKEGKSPEPPKILIELYLSDESEVQTLLGTNNSRKENSPGVKLEVEFNDEYQEDYDHLLQQNRDIRVVPIEYYKVKWYSFANETLTPRSLPVGLSNIDATSIRLNSGTDYYLQSIISGTLAPRERAALAIAYRKLKEQFSGQPAIANINRNISRNKGAVTQKDLSLEIDISQKSNWESSLIPHLDDLPFHLIGKGEQSALKILLALERQASESQVILIEEPENHLSFSSMNKLISAVQEKCAGKQIIVATHSAYVLNKLGIEKLVLLHSNKTLSLAKLPADTQNYFKKLSGYDTLRLVLAERAILVEGPSDELIVQKAYLLKYGKLPIQLGTDVINVRGLAFSRFLDVAKELNKRVAVVTDNDKDYKKNVVDKYERYRSANITICADPDDKAHTLEFQITKINDLGMLNRIFGTTYSDTQALSEYMIKNKTECALKIFETEQAVRLPQYIQDAVEQ